MVDDLDAGTLSAELDYLGHVAFDMAEGDKFEFGGTFGAPGIVQSHVRHMAFGALARDIPIDHKMIFHVG